MYKCAPNTGVIQIDDFNGKPVISGKSKARLCTELALIVAQKWNPVDEIGDGKLLEAISLQTLEVYRRAYKVFVENIKDEHIKPIK